MNQDQKEMTTPIQLPRSTPNAYTHSPELHPNLILGSLQLLAWLFFHPSAWRNYIARIDPNLSPLFSLLDLDRNHWRNPDMRRILVLIYFALPLIEGSLAALIIWGAGISVEPLSVGQFGIVFAIVAIPFIFTISFVTSLLADLVTSALLGFLGWFCITLFFIGSIGMGISSDIITTLLMLWISIGVIAILGAVARLNTTTPKSVFSKPGQTSDFIFIAQKGGGAILGIFLSIFLIGFILNASNFFYDTDILRDVLNALILSIFFCLLFRWRKFSWLKSIGSGLLMGVLFIVGVSVVISVSTSVNNDSMSANSLGEFVFSVDVPFLVVAFSNGIFFGFQIAALYAFPYAFTERFSGHFVGTIASVLLGFGYIGALVLSVSDNLFAILFSVFVGLTWRYWFYPLQVAGNYFLLQADKRQFSGQLSLFRFHSAFWDEYQGLHLFGLDEHLVLVMERNPAEGQAALEYLSTSRQRWAAQAAQIELDARGLQRCVDAKSIGEAHHTLAAGELEGPASALLRSFSKISQDVKSALGQESVYNQRLALNAVEDRLDGLLRELTRSSERYAVRFRPIATGWQKTIRETVHQLSQEAETRQEIDNPYIIGVPLTEQQEIFVGRTDITARIESLLLDQRRPPLLLYGQRRMGKTSLLNNLGRLLPTTIVPMFVDLQGPASQAKDEVGLLYNIARNMRSSAEKHRNLILPPLSREALADDPFTRFDEWLDVVEKTLDTNTALLILDEFESLDDALTKKRFDEGAVMAMLRHLIQHRVRFKVMFAASHTLEELARWASYLINAQVIHIGCLSEKETEQLIAQPTRDFSLTYQPEALKRVWELTRGHPFLVEVI